MKTDALIQMRDHAEANLWPFPDRMEFLDASQFDFNTEVAMFEINLTIVFRELKDNIIECPKEDARKYADHTIEILQEAREQVNQFFRSDIDYNKKLQQIEAEGVREEPKSGLTPADSVSGDKLEYPAEVVALYLNKICLWGEHIVKSKFASGHEIELEIEVNKLETINEKLLFLKYTGTYEFLENLCRGNKKKTASIIAALIGEKPNSIRVISTHLSTPHKKNRLSPYTSTAVANVLSVLRQLDIDTTKLEEIYNNLLRDSKS